MIKANARDCQLWWAKREKLTFEERERKIAFAYFSARKMGERRVCLDWRSEGQGRRILGEGKEDNFPDLPLHFEKRRMCCGGSLRLISARERENKILKKGKNYPPLAAGRGGEKNFAIDNRSKEGKKHATGRRILLLPRLKEGKKKRKDVSYRPGGVMGRGKKKVAQTQSTC